MTLDYGFKCNQGSLSLSPHYSASLQAGFSNESAVPQDQNHICQ